MLASPLLDFVILVAGFIGIVLMVVGLLIIFVPLMYAYKLFCKIIGKETSDS